LTGQDIITKAMVNNYVKNSIVKPPIKKHYKNYHIGFLIVVILLKPSFTMAEISEMIEIYNHLDSKTFDRDFNHFVRSYEEALQEIFRTGRIVQKDVSDCTPEQALMISAIQTAVRHIYTQHLLSKIKKLPATADSAQ
jgi:hypothetical protein